MTRNVKDKMIDKPLPVENWRLWKLVLVPCAVFAPFVALIAFIPNYSLIALIVGISLSTIGAIGAVLVGRGRRRAGQIAYGNAFLLIMFSLGARAWFIIIKSVYLWAVWMFVLLVIYLLAWAIPVLKPKLSALLWREQYYPETKIGKMVLVISAKILPIAGAGGAMFGMYATRSGHDNIFMLFIGVGFSLVSIALAQLSAHDFWRKDQRRKQIKGELE